MKKYLLGLDIGGTKVECALLHLDYISIAGSEKEFNKDFFPIPEHLSSGNEVGARVVLRKRIPTERDLGYQHVINNISKLIKDVCQEASMSFAELEGVGIGLPGTVDPANMIMLNGNSQIFIGKDVCGDLRELLDQPSLRIKCENDANCFAWAEVLCGVGHTHFNNSKTPVAQQSGIGIILGTGVGGGIVINGKIITGRHGGGGEIGHTELYSEGFDCYCGRKGCVEQYISGSGLQHIFEQETGKQLKGREIFERYDQKDQEAIHAVNTYKESLAKFLVNITNIFDPDYFVLGGGVSAQDAIYEGIEEMVSKNAFIPMCSPKVYKHALGDSAGVVGAALLLL